MATLTKTTFHLERELLTRLKAAAAVRRTTVRELLIEGAELILDKHEAVADRETLKKRSAKARERLRGGLYNDPGSSAEDHGRLLYAVEGTAPYRAR
jgi:hypothetical protein